MIVIKMKTSEIPWKNTKESSVEKQSMRLRAKYIVSKKVREQHNPDATRIMYHGLLV
jgi:hypothetical protein